MQTRAGFALVAALGILIIAASIALSVVASARASVVRADAHVQFLKGEAVARVMTWKLIDTVSVLLASPVLKTFDPVVLMTELDGMSVMAVAFDSGTKININTASADGLRRFLVTGGIADRTADIAAQSIVDWRDPDDLHHPRGAEAEWYRIAGTGVSPPNDNIASLDELHVVRGVDARVLDALKRDGTVHGVGVVNVNAAPFPVLTSLPGMSAEAAAAVVARRSLRPIDSLLDFVQTIPVPAREGVERSAASIAEQLAYTVQAVELRVEARSSRMALQSYVVAKHLGSGRVHVTAWGIRS